MANDTEQKQKVWVVTYRYEDRHGPNGMGIIGVYFDKDKAEKDCGDNIENYLREFEAIDDEGKVTDAVSEIDGETAEGTSLDAARKAEHINVDDSGTWCEWDISEEEIQ